MASSLSSSIVLFYLGLFFTSNLGVRAEDGFLRRSEVPWFVEEPDDVVVRRNESAEMRCSASSETGAVSVIWLRDGVPVRAKEGVVAGGKVLVVSGSSGRDKDKGLYRCLTKTSAGALLSRPGRLRVAYLSHISGSQGNVSVPAGGTARLTCHVESLPTASYAWNKDGGPLPENPRFLTLSSGLLLITEATKSDEGAYRCMATNSVLKKSRRSADAILNVMEPTSGTERRFLSVPGHIRAVEGDNITLECSTSTAEPLFWTLSKDGHVLPQPASKTLGANILQLQNITFDHAGVYKCTAGGSIFQETSLEVYIRPYLTKQPQSLEFPTARTARLSCEADGYPPPHITWFKDGKQVETGGRVKLRQSEGLVELVLSATVAADSGLYQCIARNAAGEVSAAGHLVVSASSPLEPPANLFCRKITETSVGLQWNQTNKLSDLPVVAYTVHYWPSGNFITLKIEDLSEDDDAAESQQQGLTENCTFNATDLKPFTNYTFYVRSYTPRAASENSQQVVCQTQEGIPEKAPNVALIVVNATKLLVSWKALLPNESNGSIFEYKVQWRQILEEEVNEVFVPGHILKYTISDVKAGVKYEVRVLARTKQGWPSGPDYLYPWMTMEIPKPPFDEEQNTEESQSDLLTLPVPVNLEAKPVSSHSMNLSWTSPVLNSPFSHYTVSISKSDIVHSLPPLYLESKNTMLEVKDLQPDTLYEVKVRIHDQLGHRSVFSEKVQCQTPLEEPENSIILDVNWQALNQSTIRVSWKHPSRQVESYTVLLIPPDGITLTYYTSGSHTSAEIGGLYVNIPYQLKVTAETSNGTDVDFFASLPQKVLIASPSTEHYTNQFSSVHIMLGVVVSMAVAAIVLASLYIIWRRACQKSMPLTYIPNSATHGDNIGGPTNGNARNVDCPLASLVSPNRRRCDRQSISRSEHEEVHEMEVVETAATNSLLPQVPDVPSPIAESKSIERLNFSSLGNVCLSAKRAVHITENPHSDPLIAEESLEHHFSPIEEYWNLLPPSANDLQQNYSEGEDDERESLKMLNCDTKIQANCENNNQLWMQDNCSNNSSANVSSSHHSSDSSLMGSSSLISDGSNTSGEQLLMSMSLVPSATYAHHIRPPTKPLMTLTKVPLVGPNV